MPVAEEEKAQAQELKAHGSDVVLTLAAELQLWACPSSARLALCCLVPTAGLGQGMAHLPAALWAQCASPGHPFLASHWGLHWGDSAAEAVPGGSFWLLHLLFSPPSRSHLLCCSSQASSESWAGWKWGICPFFPLLALSPYVSFGSEGTLVPGYTKLVGIHSLRQPESGSSFQPYLDLHSSACPKKNCMWWVKKQGSIAEIFFFFDLSNSQYIYCHEVYLDYSHTTSVVVDLCSDTQNFSACSHTRCSN